MSPIPGVSAVCGVVPLCAGASSAAGAVVGHAVGDAASSVVGDVFGAVLDGIEAAVTAALGGLGTLLGPEPDLQAQWFAHDITAMRDVGGLVELPLLFVATIGAVVRQDTGRLARIWLVALPASFFFTALAVPLVHEALGATGDLTSVLTDQAGTSAQVQALVTTLVPPLASAGGGVLLGVVGCGVLLAALVLSMELILRNAAIYLTVLFLPLVFAAAVWPPMVTAVKRALEVLAALILAKFVITATLVLGASMVSSGAGIDTVLTGLAVLLLAAFAPMAVLRLMPLVEAAAIGHLEGRARQPVHAARNAAQSARTAVSPAAAAAGLLGVGGAAEEAVGGQVQDPSTGSFIGFHDGDGAEGGGQTPGGSGEGGATSAVADKVHLGGVATAAATTADADSSTSAGSEGGPGQRTGWPPPADGGPETDARGGWPGPAGPDTGDDR